MAWPQPKLYTEDDYYNLPEDVRAELIDGQIYFQAAPSRIHQRILSEVHTMVNNYIKAKNGFCQVYPAPFAVQLFKDAHNIVEPDISVICDRSKLTDKGCAGAPDWIIEITSPSNSEHDYILKLNLYKAAGVQEYWIVNPMKETVLVYSFKENAFDIQHYTFHDKIKANIYDDLWIDFTELDL